MRSALEYAENAIGNKAAAHGQNMAVAMPMLMAAEHAHRLHQMQVLPGVRHRNVEQTALFLDRSRLPTAMSEGMQPSITFSTKTAIELVCNLFPPGGEPRHR